MWHLLYALVPNGKKTAHCSANNNLSSDVFHLYALSLANDKIYKIIERKITSKHT